MKTIMASTTVGLGLALSVASQAQATPTGCQWAKEGNSWSWAQCTGGTGQYRAWAQCQPTDWWRQWKMAYGPWQTPRLYVYSIADCGSGYKVLSYGINYR